MAPTGYDPSEIVHVYEVHDAPTGEGTRYVTADGKVWKPTFVVSERTGVEHGKKHGNRIWPRW